jgi:hypothetical protein
MGAAAGPENLPARTGPYEPTKRDNWAQKGGVGQSCIFLASVDFLLYRSASLCIWKWVAYVF